MNIAEKTVLVTGANRGIGKALVKEAFARGAKRVFAGTRSTLPNTDPRVTPLMLDVTNASQIQRAVGEVADLDVLINNAAILIYEALTDLGVIQKQLDVHLLGPLKVTQAFLPLLIRSKGAIVKQPVIGRRSSCTSHAWLLDLEGSSAQPDTVTASTLDAARGKRACRVDRICRHRYESRLRRPKVSPESAAAGIFDGLEKGEEDIFPDPTSRPLADGWRTGVAKHLSAGSTT